MASDAVFLGVCKGVSACMESMQKAPDSVLCALGLCVIGVAAFVMFPCVTASAAAVTSEFPAKTYLQELVITFKNATAAKSARVGIEPLPDGYERAVSCRWDDNEFGNLEVKNRLDARGVKATWYLNSNSVGYLDGRDYMGTARHLIEGGHTIGGHSLSHPYLTYVHKNRMFQEIAGVRIEWEAALDTLLNSFTFPFIAYRSDEEGDASQADMIRALQRAGFYHVAEFKTFHDALPSDMVVSLIMPPENNSFEVFQQAVDWALSDADVRADFPNISHSMHGWYGTPRLEYGWDELERRLDYLAAFPNHWQCNQNAYAAYRYQFEHSVLTVLERDKNALRAHLCRPVLRFLNDPVPLTIAVRDVATEEVVSVACRTADISRSQRTSPDRALFNVNHDRPQELPSRIGRVENPENRAEFHIRDQDTDFPGLGALLSFDGCSLGLQVENLTGLLLEDLVVTYRMPLGWKEGVVEKQVPRLEPGAGWVDACTPTKQADDPKYHLGAAYFVAQMDFRLGGAPGRLYATCNYRNGFDASFPKGRFSVIGPIEPERFDAGAFGETVSAEGGHVSRWTLEDASVLDERTNFDDGPVDNAFLDVEVIRTQGNWYRLESPLYVLQSVVASPRARPIGFYCNREDIPHIYLNGQEVADNEGTLAQGDNKLVLIYHHAVFGGSPRHTACFFRPIDPETGVRLADVAYAQPPICSPSHGE
ncbi:MAG TPA: polysaccharide deacetylase family protein [Candidatus Hydrogenedentes bacterium]|nr:polysaccharide deacetylase family protein [Candidatus Hydrogenedentota bacterium]